MLDYVRENGSITNKKARDILGLADSTTKRILADMVKKGILEKKGSNKNREYFEKK